MAVAVVNADERNRMYAEACAACKAGREPVRRKVYGDTWMWLHDSIQACGASALRDQHRHDDAVAAQRDAVPED